MHLLQIVQLTEKLLSVGHPLYKTNIVYPEKSWYKVVGYLHLTNHRGFLADIFCVHLEHSVMTEV